jgi:hypothetical protein
LGVAQEERFSVSDSRQFASSWASSQKNTGKIVEKALENGGKWRFFAGPKRHFAVPEATAEYRNSPVRQMLRPWSPAASRSL